MDQSPANRPIFMSHMDKMRYLIRNELVPRAIDNNDDNFVCQMCGVVTMKAKDANTRLQAHHATDCKLGRSIAVIE